MVRVAFIASLQGFPEEWDTDTEDATRIANRAAAIVAAAAPVEVTVFDRTDYYGQGDVYVKARDDAIRWGADVIVNIHQDAGAPGARGFTVLYYDDLAFARVMDESMRRVLLPLGVPARPLMPRDGVAVLKLRESVLVEAGFYTSPADEAIGTEPYAQAIAQGTLAWLHLAHGVGMKEGMEEMTARIGAPIAKEHHYPDVWLKRYVTYWLHAQNRSKEEAVVVVAGCQRKEDGGSYFTIRLDWRLAPDGQKNSYDAFDLRAAIEAVVGAGKLDGLNVSVHSSVPITCVLREAD